MNMTYCCDKFQWDCEVNHVCSTNIRVIKIDPKYGIESESPYRFFITAGYETGQKNVPSRMITYCPYCGTNLYSFYRSDEYINETDDSFYSID